MERNIIQYRIHTQPPKTPIIFFQHPEVPISEMINHVCLLYRYKPEDVRMYYGSELIEEGKLPIEYNIYPLPRYRTWGLVLVHRLPNGQFPDLLPPESP